MLNEVSASRNFSATVVLSRVGVGNGVGSAAGTFKSSGSRYASSFTGLIPENVSRCATGLSSVGVERCSNAVSRSRMVSSC